MEEVTCAPDLASVAESTGLEIATSPVDRSEESQERQEEQSGEEGIAMNGDGEEKDEATVLAELATGTRDQEDLERDIGR